MRKKDLFIFTGMVFVVIIVLLVTIQPTLPKTDGTKEPTPNTTPKSLRGYSCPSSDQVNCMPPYESGSEKYKRCTDSDYKDWIENNCENIKYVY